MTGPDGATIPSTGKSFELEFRTGERLFCEQVSSTRKLGLSG